MEWKAPEGRNAARRHPVSPLRGFRIHFEHHFLGLAPQAICCRRSAADLRNFKTYASGFDWLKQCALRRSTMPAYR